MALATTDSYHSSINPFEQLLCDCHNNPHEIQARYEAHRSNRNAQQKEKLLHPEFPGWQIDDILRRLISQPESPNGDGPFSDHRHNLNLYARPPEHIKELIVVVQQEIRDIAPSLWFSPPESLHITTLEIASSRTADEVDALATHLLQTGTAATLVEFTSDAHHRARLVKPVVSYDASAMALSFLPAAGEPTGSEKRIDGGGGAYSYHHLRRDLANMVLGSGVSLAARYVVPSAHVTIARFVTGEGEGDGRGKEKVAALVERIERVNEMLRERYWPRQDGSMPENAEWVVGQGQGLEFNKGTSWYGGGDKVLFGKGFE